LWFNRGKGGGEGKRRMKKQPNEKKKTLGELTRGDFTTGLMKRKKEEERRKGGEGKH